MIEIIICALLGGFVGYHIGIMVLSYRLRHILYKVAVDRGLIETDKQQPKAHELVVEKSSDILYLYDVDKNFICQGSTIDELAILAKQYKNIRYAAVKTDDDIFVFIDGAVKKGVDII